MEDYVSTHYQHPGAEPLSPRQRAGHDEGPSSAEESGTPAPIPAQDDANNDEDDESHIFRGER
jgi:hypothetical protein